MSRFVQVGAGAGDRDPRSNYRDGFTEYVKSLDKSTIDKIILIEPNPMNIPELQKCWANYPQAEIHQVGICTSSHNASTIKFYYAEQDGPHFHVASMKREHVEQYYRFPGDIIKEIDIVCVSLQGFINQVIGNQRIDLLCIDIEGMEAEIIPEIDWKNLNCHRLSFEFCHLGDKQEKVLRTLGNAGYIFIGTGIDYQGGDWLFENIGLK